MKGQQPLLIAVIGVFFLLALVYAFVNLRANDPCVDELTKCNSSFSTCNDNVILLQDQTNQFESQMISLNDDLKQCQSEKQDLESQLALCSP